MITALWITVIGMAITFACLGIVLLIMAIIGKLFPGAESKSEVKKG